MYYLYVVGDTNDGDYVTSMTLLKPGELSRFEPLFKEIKKHGLLNKHNWFTQEYQDHSSEELYGDLSELAEEFDAKFVPYGEYGVHTIEEVKVFVVQSITEFV